MISKRGFTLVELLLVIAIAAGIFIFSAPFALKFYKTQLVEDVRGNIVSVLARAKHNAVLQKNDSPFGIKIDNDNHEIILFQGASYGEKVSGQDEIINILSDINISGPNEFVFSKLYGLPSATGTITVIYQDQKREIIMDDSGLISSK